MPHLSKIFAVQGIGATWEYDHPGERMAVMNLALLLAPMLRALLQAVSLPLKSV
jgi:hypothetical protein